jgi:DNA-binding SARP family transcriptional activator
MEFKILGPVEVHGSNGRARLGGTKQVALLTGLIVHANRVVPVDRLVEATWGEDPLTAAVAALHTSLFRLRRALSDAEPGGGERIVTHSTGYQLRIDPGELDLDVFHEHVKRGRAANAAGRLEEADSAFQAALDLWRGPALAGVSGRSAQVQAGSLNETRLAATEEQIDVRLARGDHAALIADLNTLVAAHPLRERLRGQQLLAYYRSGRQADALAAYQEIYRLLGDELGIQPGLPLRHLHEQVLAGDPALEAPSAAATPTISVTGLVPRQLPADVANFTGREAYLEELDALLAGEPDAEQPAVLISAIAGIAGVGKTALALRWAHRIANRLPDGQLYVNLRGYAPTPPMVPTEALALFLRALGVPQAQIPLEQDEQAAMYRSLLADRRTLVVLDNAAAADQVRPLLPGSPTCLVLVTSRDDLRGLTALHGAHRLVLDVLAPEEAHTLLTRIVGAERVRADSRAATELARACGYLPLALRIAAAHLASHPHRTVAEYLAELTAGNRLGQLAIEEDREVAVRASFDLSYQTLEPDASRLFRLLGLLPGPDFSSPAAAALIDSPPEETARLLDRLAAAHLVERHAPGRYQLHDLLRLYAGERAEAEDTPQNREDALGRLFDMYLRTADAAATRLYPGIQHLLRKRAGSEARTLTLTDHTQALVWLDSERPNLVAAIRHAAEHGPKDFTWHVADALAGYFYGRMYRSDWVETAEIGLRTARETGEQVGEAAMLDTLAHAEFSFGNYEKARDYGLRASELYQQAENPAGEAEIHKRLGLAFWPLGQLDESLEHFTRARDLSRRTGNRAGESTALNGMCLVYADRGQFAEMLTHNEEALVIQREIGSRMSEGASLHLKGYAYAELGRFKEALEFVTQALALYQETGFRYNEASTLTCIAAVHRDTGNYPHALEFGHRALILSRELSDTRGESHALSGLASTYLHLDRPDDALSHGAEALRVARDTRFRRIEIDAMIGMATIHRHVDGHDEALALAGAALDGARESNFRQCAGLALTALADIQLDLGDHEGAVEHAGEALPVHREVGHRIGEARTLRTLGHAERHIHGDQAAHRHWPAALAIFTELGTPEAGQLRTLLGTTT